MAIGKTRKGARFELRAEAAEVRGWRQAARHAKVPVGEFVRLRMGEAVAKHRRVGVAMGLGSKVRLGAGEGRTGKGKPKRGG